MCIRDRLYILYNPDVPTTRDEFADDTAVFSTNEDIIVASTNLQECLNLSKDGYGSGKSWQSQVEFKSSYITCTLERGNYPTVHLNHVNIPQAAMWQEHGPLLRF